jgi:hypothetical protein
MKIKRIYRPGVPRKVICPFCNEEFPVERLLCKSSVDGKLVQARYSFIDRVLGRKPEVPLSATRNGSGGRLKWDFACPNDKCHKVLPAAVGRDASLLIGIVGASQSGKTHYVTSLIEQLQELVGSRFRAGMIPLDEDTVRRFNRELKNPLFGSHTRLPVTVGAVPPLLYNLMFDGSIWGENEPRSVTLALYDTAGENMNDRDKVRNLVTYLSVAAGIIFVVDPLQSLSLRQTLPPGTPLPDVNEESSPSAIVGRIRDMLEVTHGRFATPVAFTMTKCDVLKKNKIIPTQSPWNSNRMHEAVFDEGLHLSMQQDISEVFKRYELHTYNTFTQYFANHAFFGVSATGCSEDPATGRYKSVSPWRVEDPLLWLLAKLKVLPVK